MTPIPDPIWLYHITHVKNLSEIIKAGGLWSDAEIRRNNTSHEVIGYDHIKERRLQLPVSCHSETTVGEYVPFYFCPRSAMLYVIEKRRSSLKYQEGQAPIIHLVTRLDIAVDWAFENQRLWAFSDINAGNRLALFYKDKNDLDKINWSSVKSRYWEHCSDHKQAEFLLFSFAPMLLFSTIVTFNDDVCNQVRDVLKTESISMDVRVDRGYYY